MVMEAGVGMGRGLRRPGVGGEGFCKTRGELLETMSSGEGGLFEFSLFWCLVVALLADFDGTERMCIPLVFHD